ncbi:actin-like ATPase domain-containing protein [Patellaria atrata CBS 101060]|uniref:Actin-like ATPase domain-containing protein n=1 Tax=Patellaria atrata CBS 101060 TaxID=1346257 RepID=A0A9P4SHG8_9PEZI|nr:actin-like ATPase domain-containing protein [Patellaria atrata CBS 101060]
MTTPAGTEARRLPSARIRPGISQSSAHPPSPHTPILQRSLSSLTGSPSGSFRSEDDLIVVLDIGHRFMRAGFAGESAPRCTLNFGPEEQRRVGDYRQWQLEYVKHRRKRKRGQGWGEEYELWRMDLRDVDLGLVEDKIERALREAYSKYFLLPDSKARRITLALPPLIPRPLLSTILNSIFTNTQAPSISLLSTPIVAAVAGGLRSALVVDIGWRETTATAIFEYREVHQERSVRATRLLNEEMSKLLNLECAKWKMLNEASPDDTDEEIGFEEAEEVLTRLGWCHSREQAQNLDIANSSSDSLINIPLPKSSLELLLPFSRLADPADIALFARDMSSVAIDDHDRPLDLLIYSTLLSLPIDVRKTCMSRIVITGGGANLPGVKRRLLQELEYLIHSRGWDPVKNYGTAKEDAQQTSNKPILSGPRTQSSQDLDALSPLRNSLSPTEETVPAQKEEPQAPTNPALIEPEADAILEKITTKSTKGNPPELNGVVRGVESLGAWAGASIVTNLRIRGIVEIERDKFLSHGLGGATREKDISVVPQRQSLGPGVRPGAGDRNSWTLGVWA